MRYFLIIKYEALYFNFSKSLTTVEKENIKFKHFLFTKTAKIS